MADNAWHCSAQVSTEAMWLSGCRQQVFCMQDDLLYERLTVWETLVVFPCLSFR